jgi:hypothetical protein
MIRAREFSDGTFIYKLIALSDQAGAAPFVVFKGCEFSPIYEDSRRFRRALADSIRSSNFTVTTSPPFFPIASRVSAFTGSIWRVAARLIVEARYGCRRVASR